MTIDTIFTRFDIPADTQRAALIRGAYVRALERVWVGPPVAWPLLAKVLIFADIGEASGTVRKKIGLDKYAVTLIARGIPKYADTVAQSHDWNQIVYMFCAQRTGVISPLPASRSSFQTIDVRVTENMLRDIPVPDTIVPADEHTLRAINILHYKNPSV